MDWYMDNSIQMLSEKASLIKKQDVRNILNLVERLC